MIVSFFEYFFKPEQLEVKDTSAYLKLRENTLKIIKELPDSNLNKKRWLKKIPKMFPKKPKTIAPYKRKLQQLNRRIQGKLNG